MAVCRAIVWFFFSPSLFIGINFTSLVMYGDYMGIAISKNSSICVFNCMLYHNKKVKKKNVNFSLLFILLLFKKIVFSTVN